MRSLVFVMLACACSACGGEKSNETEQSSRLVSVPDPAGFLTVGTLREARSNHTATLLPDGRVLVVGGENILSRQPKDSVEILDLSTMVPEFAAPLSVPRSNHRAVPLDDGRVLVVGGGLSSPVGPPSGHGVLASAEIYDPDTNSWSPTGSMLEARSHFEMVKLDSGEVLVVGGGSDRHDHGSQCTGVPNCGDLADTLASAEIYDPTTGEFRATGSMAATRTLFKLIALDDGARALAISGMNDYREGHPTTELFDAATGTWSSGPDLATDPRVFHSAALLPSGQVLVGGGKLPDTWMLSTEELIDVEAGAKRVADLAIRHTAGVFVTLRSGQVLSVGGYQCPNPCGPLGMAELYDAESNSWTEIAPLVVPRAAHTATLLRGGRVLIIGGYDANLDDVAAVELSTL